MPKRLKKSVTLVEELGGETLEGSGFEDEIPDPTLSRFDGDVAIDPTEGSLTKLEGRNDH